MATQFWRLICMGMAQIAIRLPLASPRTTCCAQDIRAAVNYLRDSQLVDAVAHRRDGPFDGRWRGARLRHAGPEYRGRGDDFGRMGAMGSAIVRATPCLFWPQHDPAFIRDDSIKIAGLLAASKPPQWNNLYGNFADGSAVELSGSAGGRSCPASFSRLTRLSRLSAGWMESAASTATQPPDLKDARRTATGSRPDCSWCC